MLLSFASIGWIWKGCCWSKGWRGHDLDIFVTTSISDPTMKLVNRELLIYKCYQVDVNNIKCPLQWWEKHENMFPTIGFCARQIWGIVRFQNETERIFSLIEILTSFRRYHL
jgi:hypothetical protein